MQIRLRQHIHEISESFWYIPSLLTLAALVLAAITLHVDMTLTLQEWTEENPFFFTSGEGARTLLATLAGSSISVAGVVFSITIVVLNMAAVQFGPRLLANFMHHRGTQVVLGAFVATFTYCLVVLRFVHDQGGFIPHVSANVGFLFGLVSFFLLIYFIHHVSVFIQAARVIDDVVVRMERCLLETFPERDQSSEHAPDDEGNDTILGRLDAEGEPVPSPVTGYLQLVDLPALIATANRRDIRILMKCRPGHFVMKGAALAEVIPAAKVTGEAVDAIRDCYAFGPERSETQDPEFAAHRLVEIALRALSSSINDPFTALNSIDRLGAALALLASRQLPSRYLRDDDGRLRVITNPLTYSGIVEAAFNQVRRTASGHPAVTFRLLEVIAELGRRDMPDAFRDALAAQLDAIERLNRHNFEGGIDHDRYVRRISDAGIALKRSSPQTRAASQ